MIEVLHIYKDVEIVNAGLLEGTLKEPSTVTISYDEKPGIQALATTTPDRPPAPNQYPTHLRDGEYKRLGTVSLLAGLDLHTGRVTEIVSDHHASADCIALLGNSMPSIRPKPRFACCSTTTPPTYQKRHKRTWVFTRIGSSSPSRPSMVRG